MAKIQMTWSSMEPNISKLVQSVSDLKNSDTYDKIRAIDAMIASISEDEEEAAYISKIIALRSDKRYQFDGDLEEWFEEFVDCCWEEAILDSESDCTYVDSPDFSNPSTRLSKH